MLFRQKKLLLAGVDYTAVTKNRTFATPTWELEEAECEAKSLTHNGIDATLKVTCEPIGSLVSGP